VCGLDFVERYSDQWWTFVKSVMNCVQWQAGNSSASWCYWFCSTIV